MKTLRTATPGETDTGEPFGNKASGVTWLHDNGYQVLVSVFVERIDSPAVDAHESTIRDAVARFGEDGQCDAAIRSSATDEETAGRGRAGEYDSFLGRYDFDELFDRVRRAVAGVDDRPDTQTGVVVQRRVPGTHAGIAFSADPVSGSRTETVLNVTDGDGRALAAGRDDGDPIQVRTDDSRSLVECVVGVTLTGVSRDETVS